jgi:hypothetical protein
MNGHQLTEMTAGPLGGVAVNKNSEFLLRGWQIILTSAAVNHKNPAPTSIYAPWRSTAPVTVLVTILLGLLSQTAGEKPECRSYQFLFQLQL